MIYQSSFGEWLIYFCHRNHWCRSQLITKDNLTAMESPSVAVVAFLIVMSLTSMCLISFIVRFIRMKPPVRLTLVDLLYCDALQLFGLEIFAFLTAVVGCHLSERYFLEKFRIITQTSLLQPDWSVLFNDM